MSREPFFANPPLQRWLLVLGIDALLLSLLWWEHLHPRSSAFELGALLVLIFTVNVWVRLLRRLWLGWKVHRVFGSSIDHLRPPPLSLAYRWLSALGDVLIVCSLMHIDKSMLAVAYGVAALIVILAQCLYSRRAAARAPTTLEP